MKKATIVMWRHGATAWNDEHRFQGCNADVPLSDEGLAQAIRVAPSVLAWHPSVIVCSPLIRARQTAAPVERLLGRTSQVDDRLKEINVGEWVGLTAVEAEKLDPKYAAAYRSGLDYRHGVTGETAVELGTRVGAALREAARGGSVVLVVSHGWALQMGTANLLGWDFAQSRVLRVMANCAISVLTRTSGSWRIDQWNSFRQGD